MTKGNKLLGAILLIAGTSIGAGMLALPVVTAEYGFFPSALILILCWAVMTYSALLMLEVNLWLPRGANIISMTKETLGRTGEIIASLSYLFLLYCLIAAYLAGLNSLISEATQTHFSITLPPWINSLSLLALFGLLLYLGTNLIDYLNRILIIGLIFAFFGLISFSLPKVQLDQLTTMQFHGFWLPLPVIATAFGYQIIIPSLREYLEDDVPRLVKAILIGSLIPLFTYLIWEIVILGTIPFTGEHGLQTILQSRQPETGLTAALAHLVNSEAIVKLSTALAFFVIATSFIGVTLSLFDFVADGLKIKRTHKGRLLIALVSFTPPFLITLTYPHAFIAALAYGGIFVAILLILLPIAMTIRGRYFKKESSQLRVPGGKLAIGIATLYAFATIFIALY